MSDSTRPLSEMRFFFPYNVDDMTKNESEVNLLLMKIKFYGGVAENEISKQTTHVVDFVSGNI